MLDEQNENDVHAYREDIICEQRRHMNVRMDHCRLDREIIVRHMIKSTFVMRAKLKQICQIVLN
jgi:hypothetical protein